MKDWFAYLDGDDIGRRLELLLLDDEVEAAWRYSASVTNAMEGVQSLLASSFPSIELLLWGGDDMLVHWSSDEVTLSDLETLRSRFKETLRPDAQHWSGHYGICSYS